MASKDPVSEFGNFFLIGSMILSALFLASVFFPKIFTPPFKELHTSAGHVYRVLSKGPGHLDDSDEKAFTVVYDADGDSPDEIKNEAKEVFDAYQNRSEAEAFDAIQVTARIVDKRIGFYTKSHAITTIFRRGEATVASRHRH